MSQATPEQQQLLRDAARALARGALVTAFGHVSLRLSPTSFLVCAAKPLGLIGPGDEGTVVPVEGPLPPGVLGEVRVHQQIYRRRGDVQALCRFMSPQVMALGAMGLTPRARHGFGSYFHGGVPLWGDPTLVRDDSRAARVAHALGEAPAIVLAGNGAVTVGASLPQAVALAWFLEDAARVELAVRAAAGTNHQSFADEAQARERATWEGRIAERLWDYLTLESTGAQR
ncbi:class II aldolase/adducin family protein [Azohydromonas aeria]|uniref:class II aldolase/adducin family protein n=1 Tax=Azohydromonas aeria TaxID=2590212 RepID=UPI0012F8CEC8|nr:class II aldolase/adducin family protein [Azohydromonas aeria]